jgi:hypothetical protein
MTTTVASAVVTAASSGFDEAIGNDAQLLRDRVLEHLRQQGFQFANNRLLAPVSAAKGEIRALREEAVAAQRARARKALARDEGLFLHQLARGSAIDVAAVSPALVPVSDYRGQASRGCCGGGWRCTGPSRYRWVRPPVAVSGPGSCAR